ncbi:hypothetical protein DM01DRAFT_1407399 [Hesseltinella vesiculosa]|uniref:Uncharacterized protein n=1 Tax=Hesseltinella vesiculosa TaxID=101127 RepID=A0A1X2GIL9_9FUNG|nr:hypothetical protein DM01DRAFT_1407399 [Hesseltinella vesiculosa]
MHPVHFHHILVYISCSGEHSSFATKKNARLNKILFDDCDEAMSCYGRKIDLILSADDTHLEICSNEWKTCTSPMIRKQQSKNLRVNAQIMNNSITKVEQLFAMDFAGSTGYLFSLKKSQKEFFVASPVSRLVIPKDVKSLPL